MQPTDTEIIRLAIAKTLVEQELNETLTDEEFYALVLKAPVDLLVKRGQPHRSFGTKAIDRAQITDLIAFIDGEDR
jgi:hypothetical protein